MLRAIFKAPLCGGGFFLLTILLFSSFVSAETLSRVEKMTDTERAELVNVEKKVTEAQKEVEKVKVKIAESHNMEWKSCVEFDGDYILLYFKAYTTGYSLMLDTKTKGFSIGTATDRNGGIKSSDNKDKK